MARSVINYNSEEMYSVVRLNHYISKTGILSRRKADNAIKEGKVSVNGKVVFEPYYKVKGGDKVKISNKILELKRPVYILLNKPKGITTTLSDRFAHKKVIDLIPKEILSSEGGIVKTKGVYPVGRLDKDSSGLLILTNDGDLCYRVTHPKFSVEKEYLVRLKGMLSDKDCRLAIKGVWDGQDYLKIRSIKILDTKAKETLCKVVISEGKKRHLRRLFKKLGFIVSDLIRVRIGELKLHNLELGKFQVIKKSYIYKKLSLPL